MNNIEQLIDIWDRCATSYLWIALTANTSTIFEELEDKMAVCLFSNKEECVIYFQRIAMTCGFDNDNVRNGSVYTTTLKEIYKRIPYLVKDVKGNFNKKLRIDLCTIDNSANPIIIDTLYDSDMIEN